MLNDCSGKFFDHRIKPKENVVCTDDFKIPTEYMVQIWGGMFNPDANPSIENDYGIQEGYHYFSSEEAMNNFIKICEQYEYRSQGFCKNIVNGFLFHKRTVFCGMFEYKSQYFTIRYDFGYEFPEKAAIYSFTYGNYSCDCNRSLFINREFGEDTIPELDCGEEIKLVKYHFEYLD